MNRFLRLCAVAIMLAMVAPSTVATWYAYGDFEPNSKEDDEDFMWFDGPNGHPPRIYFNAMQSNFQFANPNVGRLETQWDSVPELFWNAMLGVWTDCNGDGYVGMAETAVEEYRNELLLDKSICPTGSKHNRDGWVTELLWIGTNIGGINGHKDNRIILDPAAMVWGDMGKPFPIGNTAAGGSCALAAIPKGTFQRTGAFLDYGDCIFGAVVGIRASSVYNTAAKASGGALQPLQNERRWDEEGHPLNRPTFGSEDAGNSYVVVQDCSKPTLLQSTVKPITDPLFPAAVREHTDNVYARGPRPTPSGGAQVNPNGNLPGTTNRTLEDTNLGFGAGNRAYDCDTSNDYGHDFYPETENTGTSVVEKSQADDNFNFTAQRRTAGAHPDGLGLFPLGYWGQLKEDVDQKDHSPTRWISEGGYLSRPRTVRSDLQPVNATYWTFYAFVGPASLAHGALPGGSAVYANEFCPNGFGRDAGIHFGWQCDADLWYRNSDGSPKTEPWTFARPGMPYNLRDVDCFDGTFLGLPVGIQTAAYGANPCGV